MAGMAAGLENRQKQFDKLVEIANQQEGIINERDAKIELLEKRIKKYEQKEQKALEYCRGIAKFSQRFIVRKCDVGVQTETEVAVPSENPEAVDDSVRLNKIVPPKRKRRNSDLLSHVKQEPETAAPVEPASNLSTIAEGTCPVRVPSFSMSADHTQRPPRFSVRNPAPPGYAVPLNRLASQLYVSGSFSAVPPNGRPPFPHSLADRAQLYSQPFIQMNQQYFPQHGHRFAPYQNMRHPMFRQIHPRPVPMPNPSGLFSSSGSGPPCPRFSLDAIGKLVVTESMELSGFFAQVHNQLEAINCLPDFDEDLLVKPDIGPYKGIDFTMFEKDLDRKLKESRVLILANLPMCRTRRRNEDLRRADLLARKCSVWEQVRKQAFPFDLPTVTTNIMKWYAVLPMLGLFGIDLNYSILDLDQDQLLFQVLRKLTTYIKGCQSHVR